MLLSSIFVCVGQLLWKLSSNGSFNLLVAGFCLYGVGAVVMLTAYKFGNLSVLQPVLSMNYVFSILLAKCVLDETVTIIKAIGILIITLSVIMIGGGED